MTTTLASHAHAHAHAHSAKISTFLAQTKPTADATSATVLFLGERGAGATQAVASISRAGADVTTPGLAPASTTLSGSKNSPTRTLETRMSVRHGSDLIEMRCVDARNHNANATRKWLHHFHDAVAVVFVVSLAGEVVPVDNIVAVAAELPDNVDIIVLLNKASLLPPDNVDRVTSPLTSAIAKATHGRAHVLVTDFVADEAESAQALLHALRDAVMQRSLKESGFMG